MTKGFSFASVILSYFLIGGGMFTGTLLTSYLHVDSEYVAYGLLALGALVGGFIAARASRGSTVAEPALGAVLVVGSIVGLGALTPYGQLLWGSAHDQTLKFVASVGVAGVVGALVGASLSEKLFGESTTSSVPWLLYTALTTFGSSVLVVLLSSLVFMSERGSSLNMVSVILIGMAVGCLLGGIAVGASARARPLLAAFLGGGIGIAGLFTLIARAQSQPMEKDATIGFIVLAVGGSIVTLIGTAIGWAAIGRRQAG